MKCCGRPVGAMGLGAAGVSSLNERLQMGGIERTLALGRYRKFVCIFGRKRGTQDAQYNW